MNTHRTGISGAEARRLARQGKPTSPQFSVVDCNHIVVSQWPDKKSACAAAETHVNEFNTRADVWKFPASVRVSDYVGDTEGEYVEYMLP